MPIAYFEGYLWLAYWAYDGAPPYVSEDSGSWGRAEARRLIVSLRISMARSRMKHYFTIDEVIAEVMSD